MLELELLEGLQEAVEGLEEEVEEEELMMFRIWWILRRYQTPVPV